MVELEDQFITSKKKPIGSILKEQRERFLEISERSEGIQTIACIPAYKEEKSIASVILKTREFVDLVVVCDDGSDDMTCEIAESLGAVVVCHTENRGKGAALRSAFQEALMYSPMFLVSLDADGQHLPEEIPNLIKPLRIGEADIVIGSRYLNGNNVEAPLYRKVGLGVIQRLFNHSVNHEVKDSQSGYRAFSRDAVERLLGARGDGFGYETEQLAMATHEGLRIKEVEVNIKYRDLGKTSKVNPVRHGSQIVSSILNLVVTRRPIGLIGLPGFASVLLGILSLSLFFYYYNTSRYFSVPLAIISTATIIFGTMLVLISLVLYAIKEVNDGNPG